MRRLTGLILLCSSLALLGAAKPAPKPTAAPTPAATPAATAAPATTGAPTVIVYPFETSGDMQKNTGGAIAQIYSQVFTNSGGLTVLPIAPTITRADFQKHARDVHADYYISGYLTSIGEGAAVVEQVVSVDSGIIVYSQTAQIYSVPDVASQALNARHVILQLSGKDTASLGAQQSNATPEPTTTNGAQVSLGGLGAVVQSIFHRGSGPKNTAAATPAPARVKPARTMLVARVNGNAQPGALTSATETLLHALDQGYATKTINAESTTVAKGADAICGTSRNNTIAAGSLNIEQQGARFGSRSVNVFTLTVYTCFGAPLFQTTQRDGNLGTAINAAVAAYEKDHPDNS